MHSWNRSVSFTFAGIVLAAVFARALIPAGFMPGTAGGHTTLTICTARGLSTVDVPAHDAPAPLVPVVAGDGDHCPFAPVPTLAAATVSFSSPPFVYFIASVIVPSAHVPIAAVFKSFAAQAPPV